MEAESVMPFITFAGVRSKKVKKKKWTSISAKFPLNRIVAVSLVDNKDTCLCGDCSNLQMGSCPLRHGEPCPATDDYCYPDEDYSYIELETDEYFYRCGHYLYYSNGKDYSEAAKMIYKRILSGEHNVNVDLDEAVEEFYAWRKEIEANRLAEQRQEFWDKFNKPDSCQGCPAQKKDTGICKLGFNNENGIPAEKCLKPGKGEKWNFHLKDAKDKLNKYGKPQEVTT